MPITKSDLCLGPDHLERKLSSRFEKKLEKDQRLNLYKQLINEADWRSRDSRTRKFCLGYLNHQAARLAIDLAEKMHFREVALQHYLDFIRRKAVSEEQFFACFSAGVLSEALELPWKGTEQQFLMAYEMRPKRGEPISRIIEYYISRQQWAIAFLFSSSAKDFFFGGLPKKEKWGVDESFYNWRVLHLHAAACYSLGKRSEATETFGLLYSLTQNEPGLFLQEEIDRISSQKSLFPEFEIYVKNSPQFHLQK
jgi:hypothetical protein